MDELMRDMQSTAGFHLMDDNSRTRLLRAQREVYGELETIVKNAEDQEDVVLDRRLELKIADVYEGKKAAAGLMSEVIANRSRAVDAETEAALAREPDPDEQRQLFGIQTELSTRGREVVEYVKGLLGRKDKKAEQAIQSTQEANSINSLRALLAEPVQPQVPKTPGKKLYDAGMGAGKN